MKIGLIVVAVLLLVGMGACSKFVSVRNDLVTQREAVNAAWAQVDVALQRRADLIPNLVETVKGFAKHETEVFKNIADARAALGGARTPQEKIAANDQLSGALSRLLVITENYPQLRSNENFLRLQDELAGTENRIAVERRKYNEALQHYNTQIQRFPEQHRRRRMCGLHPQRCLFQDRARRSDAIQRCNFEMTSIFGNYINGEWVNRRRHVRKPQSRQYGRSGRPVREGHGRRMSMTPPRPPPRRFPGWSTMSGPARGNILYQGRRHPGPQVRARSPPT